MLNELSFIDQIKETFRNFLKKENIFFCGLIIIIFFIDRFSKVSIINNFSDSSYFVNQYINFDLVWNIGIGFGLLSTDSTIIYNIVSSIILAVIFILIYILLVSKGLEKISYSIIIGGAFGNFYDRLIYKAVPDFIDLHYNNFHWFTFNVADIFITIGIFAYIMKGFFIKENTRKNYF